jgi:predicted nucleic-acid-binding protein
MIGLDTNVLVRFLMRDDARQTPLATSFISSLTADSPGYISIAVVGELVWVLHYAYRVQKTELLLILSRLAASRCFLIEQRTVFLQAWRTYSGSSVDFVDCVIAGVARQAGCSDTYTFDRKAARRAGMRLLA